MNSFIKKNKRYIINLMLIVMGMVYMTCETTFFKILGALIIGYMVIMDANKWTEKAKVSQNKEKYNINLDKPLAIIVMVSLFFGWFGAYTQKNLFDFILFSTFLILLQSALFKDIKKMKPFIEKSGVKRR